MKETKTTAATPVVLKQRALERWENEGGEIPNVPIPQPAAMSTVRSPRKKLFVFDLDGTLAQSKAPLDAEMAALLKSLLGQVKVAVISGGDWPQFEAQLLANLAPDTNLKNLSLLPTCGTKFHQFDSDWQQLYADDFAREEKEKIFQSLEDAVGVEDFGITETWGEQIEDRGSQITFSALGQRAPLEKKERWDADFAKRNVPSWLCVRRNMSARNWSGPAHLASCFRMQRNAQTVTALPASSDNQSASGVCMKSSESSNIHKLRKTNTPAMTRASSANSNSRLLFMATAWTDRAGAERAFPGQSARLPGLQFQTAECRIVTN